MDQHGSVLNPYINRLLSIQIQIQRRKSSEVHLPPRESNPDSSTTLRTNFSCTQINKIFIVIHSRSLLHAHVVICMFCCLCAALQILLFCHWKLMEVNSWREKLCRGILRA